MISLAHFPENREDIIRLWSVCFGDARHYIEFFLDNLPSENVLFVYKNEGNIAGMFFLMPAKLRYEADNIWCEKSIYYVYAVGVAPEYRKHGIAGKMLEFAKGYAAREEAELCLVPADDNLGSYYAKRGFEPVFDRYREYKEINESVACKFVNALKIDSISNIYLLDKYIEALYNKRAEALKLYGAFSWELNNYRFALIEHLYTGGTIYIMTDSLDYAVVRNKQGRRCIREALIEGEIIGALGLCVMVTNMSYGKEFINSDNDKYINFCFD